MVMCFDMLFVIDILEVKLEAIKTDAFHYM